MKFRTAQINALRGLLAEYGEVMPQGRHAMAKRLPDAFARLTDRLPAVLIETLREQFARIGQLDEQVATMGMRRPSSPAGSSPPGWDWYRDRPAPAVE